MGTIWLEYDNLEVIRGTQSNAEYEDKIEKEKQYFFSLLSKRKMPTSKLPFSKIRHCNKYKNYQIMCKLV